MARFRLFLGRKLIREYKFEKGPVHIGRLADANIFIENEAVSRKHAVIQNDQGQWSVKIEDGKNGLFVNGQFTTSRNLITGDKIEIGRHVIHFIDTPRAISLDEQNPVDSGSSMEKYLPDDENAEDFERGVDQQTVMVKFSELKRIHETNQNIMGAHLSWFQDKEKKLWPLEDLKTLIGKAEDCQILMRGGLPGVNHFALITKTAGNFTLEPLSRFVPIKHNGEVIKAPIPLMDGDRLQIFNQTFQFHEEM